MNNNEIIKLDLEKELESVDKTWLEGLNLSKYKKELLEFTSPNKGDVFNALKLFKPEETKVLIIGQDPYPNSKKACGLAFLHDTKYHKIDDTLKNILNAVGLSKTTTSSISYLKVATPNLNWAKYNKVLLLNTSLTYKEHPNKGLKYTNEKEKNKRKKEREEAKKNHQEFWKPFIKSIVTKLIELPTPLVIFLWGSDANSTFLEDINGVAIDKKMLILSTSHPSNNGNSVNRGFSENAPKHFKLCNDFLKKHGKKEVYWKDLRNIYTKKD